MNYTADNSAARCWIVPVTVNGLKNRRGKPLRTDIGLGGADVVLLQDARSRVLEYRRIAKQGLNPHFNAAREIPMLEKILRKVHIKRLPTLKNEKRVA
ncbi:MAG: hypothetical protein AAGK37_11350 [Pseudomonadota bacterium]